MKESLQQDPWLGSIHSFPTVLHARASLSFDIGLASLQKALVLSLSFLRESPVTRKITVADRNGYSDGSVHFKIGVGNGEGFDVLDVKEEARLFDRIERRGAFDSLDLAFHIHYRIDDGQKHRVHQDQYLIRLVFEPGRGEALIHHMKGIRRIDPSELLVLIVQRLNTELTREGLPSISLDDLSST